MAGSTPPFNVCPLVGTAGWSLPLAERGYFPAEGSHLERYSNKFKVVEINSSFHRPHRPETWAKWRDVVPPGFLFSVKLPKTITHTAKLVEVDELLKDFLLAAGNLETKLGCWLAQLPPSLTFDIPVAEAFFSRLRNFTSSAVVCEPRHASWFTPEAEALLTQFRIARVAADPPPVPTAAIPGGWRGLTYFRLHGSPNIYYSAYAAEFLDELTAQLRSAADISSSVWCIFDNTTLGAATRDALDLSARFQKAAPELISA